MRRLSFIAIGLVLLAACTDLKLASRRAIYDASLATPQTQQAYAQAEAAIEEINAEDERALGEAVALRIVANTTKDGQPSGLLLSDRDLAAYVAMVGNLVALHGERQIFPPRTTPRIKARRFVFSILDTDQVGAYSTPGGYVFVTRGLLEKLESESELAWVLGHEISHVDHEDGLSALKADLATRTAMGSLADSLKGTPKGQSAFKNQEFFDAVADRFYDLYDRTGLNRDVELRADKTGAEYATAAGYDGAGAARALDHLNLGHSIGGFMTHGSAKERLESVGDLVNKPGKTGAERYDRTALARLELLASNGGGAP